MVGRATVDRWIARDRHLGDVSAFAMGGARHAYVVTKEGEDFLRDAITETPDSSRQELVDAYEQEFGVLVSLTAMGDTLRRMGLTRKRPRRSRRMAGFCSREMASRSRAPTAVGRLPFGRPRWPSDDGRAGSVGGGST